MTNKFYAVIDNSSFHTSNLIDCYQLTGWGHSKREAAKNHAYSKTQFHEQTAFFEEKLDSLTDEAIIKDLLILPIDDNLYRYLTETTIPEFSVVIEDGVVKKRKSIKENRSMTDSEMYELIELFS